MRGWSQKVSNRLFLIDSIRHDCFTRMLFPRCGLRRAPRLRLTCDPCWVLLLDPFIPVIILSFSGRGGPVREPSGQYFIKSQDPLELHFFNFNRIIGVYSLHYRPRPSSPGTHHQSSWTHEDIEP